MDGRDRSSGSVRDKVKGSAGRRKAWCLCMTSVPPKTGHVRILEYTGTRAQSPTQRILTVVLSPLRNDHHITGFDLLLLSRYDGLADSRGKDEVLVDGVDLVHQHVVCFFGNNTGWTENTGARDLDQEDQVAVIDV